MKNYTACFQVVINVTVWVLLSLKKGRFFTLSFWYFRHVSLWENDLAKELWHTTKFHSWLATNLFCLIANIVLLAYLNTSQQIWTVCTVLLGFTLHNLISWCPLFFLYLHTIFYRCIPTKSFLYFSPVKLQTIILIWCYIVS